MRDPKRILITGTTSGLGLAMLGHYASQGHPVVSVNRRRVPDLERQFPGVAFEVADIADSDSISGLLQGLIGRRECPDVFVLNAGINEMDHEGRLDLACFRKVMRTNLAGTLTFVEAIQKNHLQGRTIVGVSSTSVIVPNSRNLGYYISKLAIRDVFRLLSRTDRANAYKVLVLGPIHTALNRNLPRPEGLQGRIFDFLSEDPADEAVRCAKFISSPKRVLHPPFKTRVFYFLLKTLLKVYPGFYYQPYR